MDPQTKKQMEDILKGSHGVNRKLEQIMALLTTVNLAYGIVLKPGALCVHPQNRGSQMVNPFDCHKKGAAILASGLKPDLLSPSSISIEMSGNPTTKQKQLDANEKMAQTSNGLLPKPNGLERYLTLGNSHWVMFCKAMEEQSLSPQGEKLHTPPELAQLMNEGWTWTAISSVVEECFPAFPSFCQGALNSVNSNSTSTSELEAMLQMASYVKSGLTM